MNDRTRFAKCFIMIVEECKSWLQVFAENRVKARSNTTTLQQFITSKKRLSSDPMIKEVLNKYTKPSDFDITVLRLVIFVGNLLDSHEFKQKGNLPRQTLGDFVQRICVIRNSFMHTTRAALGETDYDDYLAEFREIAKPFEIQNNVATGYYVKKINDIDDKPLDVEKTIVQFNVYVRVAIKHELSMIPPESEHTAHAEREQDSPTPSTSTEKRKISKKNNIFQLLFQYVYCSFYLYFNIPSIYYIFINLL